MQLVAVRTYDDFGTPVIDKLYRRHDGSLLIEERAAGLGGGNGCRTVEVDEAEADYFLKMRVDIRLKVVEGCKA